jgi:hypothetical protein
MGFPAQNDYKNGGSSLWILLIYSELLYLRCFMQRDSSMPSSSSSSTVLRYDSHRKIGHFTNGVLVSDNVVAYTYGNNNISDATGFWIEVPGTSPLVTKLFDLGYEDCPEVFGLLDNRMAAINDVGVRIVCLQKFTLQLLLFKDFPAFFRDFPEFVNKDKNPYSVTAIQSKDRRLMLIIKRHNNIKELFLMDMQTLKLLKFPLDFLMKDVAFIGSNRLAFVMKDSFRIFEFNYSEVAITIKPITDVHACVDAAYISAELGIDDSYLAVASQDMSRSSANPTVSISTYRFVPSPKLNYELINQSIIKDVVLTSLKWVGDAMIYCKSSELNAYEEYIFHEQKEIPLQVPLLKKIETIFSENLDYVFFLRGRDAKDEECILSCESISKRAAIQDEHKKLFENLWDKIDLGIMTFQRGAREERLAKETQSPKETASFPKDVSWLVASYVMKARFFKPAPRLSEQEEGPASELQPDTVSNETVIMREIAPFSLAL